MSELAPAGIETAFPRCGPSYAELTIPRRQTATDSADVLLASHFAGRPLDPGADEIWDRLHAEVGDRLRMVEWKNPQDLHSKIVEELVAGLGLSGPDDELGFELSLGGTAL